MGTAAFSIPFDGNWCAFEDCLPITWPITPTSHAKTHIYAAQSVSSELVAPVVVLEHILRPLLDHVTAL